MSDIANTQNYKMVLRFNTVNNKLDDGYLRNMIDGKNGKPFTPREAYLYLHQNPSMRVDVLYV